MDQRNFYARTFRPAVVEAKFDGDRLAHTAPYLRIASGYERQNGGHHCPTYAHLSPSFLHAAVEAVAAYGKPTRNGELISVGTVIETGNDPEHGQGHETEVVEKVGAGDGI